MLLWNFLINDEEGVLT